MDFFEFLWKAAVTVLAVLVFLALAAGLLWIAAYIVGLALKAAGV